MIRKFCLHRNIFQISRVLRPDLVNKSAHQIRHESTEKPAMKESEMLSRFVPNHWPERKFTLLDDNFKVEDDYSNKSTEEVLQAYERLSYHCKSMNSSISETKYDPLIKAVIDKLPDMTDDEVIKVLADLSRFPPEKSPRAHNYCELWNSIDHQFWDRSKHWRFPLLLKVMNAYYRLGINRISQFNRKALLKMATKIEHIEPKYLVEMMFYQCIIRNKDVPMYTVEAKFYEMFHQLTLNEIGIIGLAFFKRESKILNCKLLDMMYERLINEIDNVHDLTLVNFMKILRYSSKPSHCHYINQLCEKLLPHVEKYNPLALTHIALLGINLQNCHYELTVKIIELLNKNIKKIRLKDLDRMTLVVSLFDIKTESGIEMEFLKNVQEELKIRVDEIMKHPRCFTSTVHYLTMKNVVDMELIQAALKENFLLLAYGKNLKVYTREILCLESFTKINLKGIYKGPELSEKVRRNIATFQSNYIPYRGQKWHLTHTDKVILDVKEFAEVKFGYNILTQALPHFERPDIIYCFDENGKSITKEVESCYQGREEHSGEIYTKEKVLSKKPELASRADKLRLMAIVIGGWNFYVRGTDTPTGSLRMKLEQLQLIGYIPVLVGWHEWANKSITFKEELFTQKMNEALGVKN